MRRRWSITTIAATASDSRKINRERRTNQSIPTTSCHAFESGLTSSIQPTTTERDPECHATPAAPQDRRRGGEREQRHGVVEVVVREQRGRRGAEQDAFVQRGVAQAMDPHDDAHRDGEHHDVERG